MGIFRKSMTDQPYKDNQPTKHAGLFNRIMKHRETPETKENNGHVSSEGDIREIYSTKDKQIRYKNETPIESEKIRSMQEQRKRELISGEASINLKGRDKVDNIELKTEGNVKVSKDVIETVGKFHNIHSAGNDSSDVFDTGELAKLPVLTNKEKVVTRIPTYEHDSKIQYIKIKAGRFSQVVESEYDQYLINNDPTISKRQQIQDQIPENKSLLYHLNQVASKYKAESKNEDEREKNQRDIAQERIKHEQRPIEESAGERRQSKSENNKRRQPDPFEVSVVGKRTAIPKKSASAVSYEEKPEKKGSFFSAIGHFFKVLFSMIASIFMSPNNKDKRIPQSKKKNDYQDRQDARFVLSQIKSNIFNLTVTLVLLILVFAFFFVISVMESREGDNLLSEYTSYAPMIFAGVNFILLILSGIIYRKYLVNGFSSLRKFSGSVDSAVAIAYTSCIIQCITALITPSSFMGGNLHFYSILVVASMIFITAGRLYMESRVKSNFKFLVSKSPAYVVKTFGDEQASAKMLSGTSAHKHNLVYQHETEFLSDYLKIAYAPDPSEEICGKFSPIILWASIFVGVIYYIIAKDIIAALSSVAVICCIGLPFVSVLAGNLPIYLFSKKSLRNSAMVNGFPCIRNFCDSSGIILKASDLYPAGSVKLHGIRNYVGNGIDNVLLCAGVVLKEIESPLYQVFNEELRANRDSLPRVESVVYEEKCGVVGWIKGSRILIGNRDLMESYNIYIESETAEQRYARRGQFVTFIAYGGSLAAMVTTSYVPNQFIQRDLYKAEERGLCFVISSTDPNLTHQKIISDYNLYTKSVKIVPLGYSNMCSDMMHKKTLTAGAYLATRGRFPSFCKAVSGCIKLKSNLTMGLIIELFGTILGIVLCAAVVFSAGVGPLNVFSLLLYVLFWVLATLIAELLRKP